MRRLALAVVSTVTVFAGGACSGESPPEEASEESAKVEEAAKRQGSGDLASVDCQIEKAEADLGVAGTEELVAEWHTQEVAPYLEEDFSSALEEAKDLRTFLAERGYTC